ncbi:hypothetical protein P7C70_g6732, partial [Phenoliferia sp. Uapishka_3]
MPHQDYDPRIEKWRAVRGFGVEAHDTADVYDQASSPSTPFAHRRVPPTPPASTSPTSRYSRRPSARPSASQVLATAPLPPPAERYAPDASRSSYAEERVSGRKRDQTPSGSRRVRGGSPSQMGDASASTSRRRAPTSAFPTTPRSQRDEPSFPDVETPRSNARTRSASSRPPEANIVPIKPNTTSPPPRPRRSPRRSAPSSPPPQPTTSSRTNLDTPTRTPKSDPRKWYPSPHEAPSQSTMFRLDRPQAIPASFISARESLTAEDLDRFLAQRLPEGWKESREDAETSRRGKDGEPDPEEWARQRRMSSLLSGIGAVFGSLSVPQADLAEDTDEDEYEEEQETLGEGFRGIVRPYSPKEEEEETEEAYNEGEDYGSSGTDTQSVGSGSECYESAEEGEDGSWSPSGRRVSSGRQSRSSYVSEASHSTRTPATIESSPTVHSISSLRRSSRPISPSHTPNPKGASAVSIAFGYAYDSLDLEDSPPLFPKEDEAPTSVKQLVRESWRRSYPVNKEPSLEEEKRTWTRAVDQLKVEDRGLNLPVADNFAPKLATRSSYIPSSRPLVSRTNTATRVVPHAATPQVPPDPPRIISNTTVTSPNGENSSSRRPRARYPSSTGVVPPTVVDEGSRRRSLSASGAPSPNLRAATSSASLYSPATLSLPRATGSRPLSRQLSMDFIRPRATPEPSSVAQSKSSRRLSGLFHIGPSRSRSVSRDGDVANERRDPSPRRAAPEVKKRVSPIISSPTFNSLTPSVQPASSATPSFIGSSPFTTRTWRSTVPTRDYESLLAQYGRLELRRQEVIWELCETERSFVTGLRGVTRVFSVPLRTPEGAWIKGVPAPVSRLLDWLDDILAVHNRISEALQHAIETNCTPRYPLVTRIADVLLPYVTQLEVHQPYLVRFETVTKSIDSMTADSTSDFGEFVRMQSRLPDCGALSLSSFLLKPVQRLMKYPLFFQQLADLTPPAHPDRIATLSLLHSTDSMIRVMQEVKTREDEYEEAKVLQSRIRGLPEGFKLARRDRRLVAHGALRQVHISDRDRTVLEMDAMARASTAGPRTSNVFAPGPEADVQANSTSSPNPRRHSTISDSGSSNRSVGSLTYSETSGGSRTSPSTPVTPSFETLLRPDTLALGNFATVDSSSKVKPPRLIKTKAKESSIYAFVFSDLVVLATKISDPVRFIRTPKTSTRRLEQGPTYKALETIGLSRVLGVSDLSGKTEHDHLIEVDLLPIPTGDEFMASFSLNTAALATSIYFTVPNRAASTSRHHVTGESPIKERARWLQAFERSYLFALRSLSFPSQLNAQTAPITQSERLSCTSFLEAGIIPKSPSEQRLDIVGSPSNATYAKADGAQEEREERAYWAVRLKRVRRELEDNLTGQMGGKDRSSVVGEAYEPRSTKEGEENRGVRDRFEPGAPDTTPVDSEEGQKARGLAATTGQPGVGATRKIKVYHQGTRKSSLFHCRHGAVLGRDEAHFTFPSSRPESNNASSRPRPAPTASTSFIPPVANRFSSLPSFKMKRAPAVIEPPPELIAETPLSVTEPQAATSSRPIPREVAPDFSEDFDSAALPTFKRKVRVPVPVPAAQTLQATHPAPQAAPPSNPSPQLPTFKRISHNEQNEAAQPPPQTPALQTEPSSASATSSVRSIRSLDRGTVAGPFSFPPAARSLAPRDTPTVDPRRRPPANGSTSASSNPPAATPPPIQVSTVMSEKKLRQSVFYQRHRTIFEKLSLPHACANALGLEASLAKRIVWKCCSCLNGSGTQTDASLGGENWALIILLAALGSKQASKLDDIQIIFLNGAEVVSELLAASYIALVTKPAVVDFFCYSEKEPLRSIFSSGFAIVPTLEALMLQSPPTKAFLQSSLTKPDVNVVVHPSSLVLASCKKSDPIDAARIKDLIEAGDLNVLDPHQLFRKFDSQKPVTTQTELDDIENYLVDLRRTLPNNIRRFVIVSNRALPAEVVKYGNVGIEVLSWTQLRDQVEKSSI